MVKGAIAAIFLQPIYQYKEYIAAQTPFGMDYHFLHTILFRRRIDDIYYHICYIVLCQVLQPQVRNLCYI